MLSCRVANAGRRSSGPFQVQRPDWQVNADRSERELSCDTFSFFPPVPCSARTVLLILPIAIFPLISSSLTVRSWEPSSCLFATRAFLASDTHHQRRSLVGLQRFALKKQPRRLTRSNEISSPFPISTRRCQPRAVGPAIISC